MSDDFYRLFEDRHRGSRELIKSRLRVYLPFVEPLKHTDADATVIDLGCGRGEWLELLKEIEMTAHGVDLDDGMLLPCKELGLSVEIYDAILYLKSLADESQSVISAFHVVEHIAFEQLQALVLQAFRVLKPGGLLIMETPNPENIVVATRNFYLDPTHKQPIPPDLLSFLPDYYGFARTKIIRLQESKLLAQQANLTLQDVLGGASPDYAVMAQKAAGEDLMSPLDAPFAIEYGLSLENLTGSYQSQIEARFHNTEAKAQQTEAKAQQAEAKAQQAEAKAQQAKAKAQQAEAKAQQAETKAQQAETKAVHAETRTQQAHQVLYEVENSRSWRITAPMRWFVLQRHLLREQGLKRRTKALIKKIITPMLRRCIQLISARPVLRASVTIFARCMGLYPVLSSVHRRLSNYSHTLPSTAQHQHNLNHANNWHQLTPGAQQIYIDLKAAIQKDKETT